MGMTLFDALFEQWRETDQAANVAWSRLHAASKISGTYVHDLVAAMKLQHEALELLGALREELRKERQQVPVI